MLFKDFKSINGKDMKDICFGTGRMNLNDCGRCYKTRDILGNCGCSELKVFRRFKDIENYEKRLERYKENKSILREL